MYSFKIEFLKMHYVYAAELMCIHQEHAGGLHG